MGADGPLVEEGTLHMWPSQVRRSAAAVARYCRLSSSSSSSAAAPSRREHLDLTAASPRGLYAHAAVVTRARDIPGTSPVVRRIVLHVSPATAADPDAADPAATPSVPFTYRPGQWADVEVVDRPDLPVGGYSFLSCPGLPPTLARHVGVPSLPSAELAVRAGRHPTASFLTGPALEVGQRLQVRTGGVLHEALARALRGREGGGAAGEAGKGEEGGLHLLFVAGGVGVNPLLSLALHAAADAEQRPVSVSFVFSARTEDGLCFAPELRRLREWSTTGSSGSGGVRAGAGAGATAAARPSPFFHLFLTATRAGGSGPAPGAWAEGPGVNVGRATRDRMSEVLAPARAAGLRTVAFVCGPPPMSDDVLAVLREEGERRAGSGEPGLEAHAERWW